LSSNLPDPHSAPELFEGLLARRVVAYIIDLIILAAITFATLIVGIIGGIVTLGAAFFALPFAIPIAIAFYYGATLGSVQRATIGMRIMDIVLTPTRGAPLNGVRAFIHPVVFWLTCWFLTPFSFLFALFSPRRELLHDMIVGTLMVRRSPMERHWANTAL